MILCASHKRHCSRVCVCVERNSQQQETRLIASPHTHRVRLDTRAHPGRASVESRRRKKEISKWQIKLYEESTFSDLSPSSGIIIAVTKTNQASLSRPGRASVRSDGLGQIDFAAVIAYSPSTNYLVYKLDH